MKLLSDYDIVLQSFPNLIELDGPTHAVYWTLGYDGWDVADRAVMDWAATLPDYEWHVCNLSLSFAGIGKVVIRAVVTKANSNGWDTRAAVEDYATVGYQPEAN